MKQMYKVFLNDRVIEITSPENGEKNNLAVNFEDLPGKETLREWFAEFLKEDSKTVSLVHSNPGRFFRHFRSVFKEMPAAGGVVMKSGFLLFILRNGVWDLPKGKIDRDETPDAAALREVSEECGISGQKIEKQLPSTYHIYPSPYPKTKGKWIFKETFWYEMNYDGPDEGIPQTDEGISLVKWFAPNELDEVLAKTYENLKQIIVLYRC